MERTYDDIIDLPHPTSKKHPRMSMTNRAAQFSPFAALTGYDAAIRETGRLTDKRHELSDEANFLLGQKLVYLKEHIRELPVVSVTHFVPDSKKDGGVYETFIGPLRRIDEENRQLIFTDGTVLALDDISCIRWEDAPKEFGI